MKKREPISHIMTSHVFTVKETDQLVDVLHIFRKNKIRHLPVMKGNVVSGIISSTDVNRLTFWFFV
jgi:signal-transduction protein with cAMP-binding, CBS, and nucleotidyltransferase domain